MEVFHLLGFTMAFLMKESLTEAVGYFRSGGTGKSEKGSPLVFSCPICFKKLKASKTGKFRCPFCGNILAIGDDGEIALA
jgi:anti-sigma B factor antagonist